jgi:hypothetical protein
MIIDDNIQINDKIIACILVYFIHVFGVVAKFVLLQVDILRIFTHPHLRSNYSASCMLLLVLSLRSF